MSITLRPVKEADLETLYSLHTQIGARGDFFPRNIASQPAFARAFTETGFWEKEEGMLLVVDADDTIIGHVEFFKRVPLA